MKSKYFIVLILLIITIIPINIKAEDFKLYSNNVILYNVEEDKIMYEKNSDEKAHIASLTKVMTALVVIENTKDFKEKIDFKRVNIGKLIEKDLALSSLDKKKSYTIDDVLYDFIMESSADCGYALALNTAKTEDEFVKMMNKKAKELNMKNTSFANPVGLDDKNNYSTMSDMLLLMKEAIKNEKLKEIMSTFTYITNDKIKIHHTMYYYTNHFKLNMPYLNGGKTGHEEIPGFALASFASNDESNYILVTTNAPYYYDNPTHFKDAKKIYEYYLKNYGYEPVIKEDETLIKIKPKYSSKKIIDIKSKKDIKYYLNKNFDKNKIKAKYEGNNPTPFMKIGTKIGKITFYYDSEKLGTKIVTLDQKVPFSLINLLKENKYLTIAISSYLAIFIGTIIIAKQIIKKARKKNENI